MNYQMDEWLVIAMAINSNERWGKVVQLRPNGAAEVWLPASKEFRRESRLLLQPTGSTLLGTFVVVRQMTQSEIATATGTTNGANKMGYSESRKTLERVRPYLADLEKGIGTRWELAEGVSATDFAYKMREGLYIATLYPTEYPALALAHATFRIERVDKRTVQAVFKNKTLDQGISGTITVHGLENAEKGPTTLVGEMDATRIIGAWHNIQPSNTPMHFPQANLSREELLKLHSWAEKRTPKWLILVSNEGSLTLQMWSRDMDGTGWDPSDD